MATTAASAAKQIVVVGGNGFLGSAVCRKALAKGFEVTSISSSGRPFTTPKGHSPAWVKQVDWRAASALDPPSYRGILDGKSAVVHTLGVLLEGGTYKTDLRSGNLGGLLSAFARNLGVEGGSGNPLSEAGPSEYERLNRDSALRVFETFRNARRPKVEGEQQEERTFVYVSAEDIFRPFVPRKYIDTKREAERLLSGMAKQDGAGIREVFVRPGLMYHAHLRPLTTPLAVLLDASARLHKGAPATLSKVLPSSILRAIAEGTATVGARNFASDRGNHPANYNAPPNWAEESEPPEKESESESSPLESMANAMEVPPMHVDLVADAIVRIVESRPDVRGAVGVERMRRDILGWERRV